MPTVRIRTHDPDAVSFFTAKLADCGFDVEFAAPGQRVRGDVDLEITVNYTSKSSSARKNTRNSVPLIRPSAPQKRTEWTTPYHAEAPELADEFPSSRGARSDVSKDRELARILAGGPKRGEMFVIGIQGQQDQPAVPANTEALEAQLPVPEPPLAIQPVEVRPRPSGSSRPRNRQMPTRSSVVPRRSALQRYSASATAIILTAAIALFYLSLFGNSNYAAENSRLSTMPSRKSISAATVTQPPQPASSTKSEPAEEKIDLVSHSSNSDPEQTRRVGADGRPAEHEEPEVIVRHFSTTTNDKTAKQSSDQN